MVVIIPRAIQTGRHWLFAAFPCLLFFILFDCFDECVCAAQSLGVQTSHDLEFSARLNRRTDGKISRAQLFVKGDRYRIEHLGGIKTDLGYATVTIVRLDRQQVWYVLSQRRLVVEVPLTLDDVLPLAVALDGEVSRVRIGDALIGDQEAGLYEVVVNRHDGREAYYEWVDESRQLLLKLASQDRDWSVAYDRVILSGQPDYFFETPLGYRTLQATEKGG